jgi:hypothetical protein
VGGFNNFTEQSGFSSARFARKKYIFMRLID